MTHWIQSFYNLQTTISVPIFRQSKGEFKLSSLSYMLGNLVAQLCLCQLVESLLGNGNKSIMNNFMRGKAVRQKSTNISKY